MTESVTANSAIKGETEEELYEDDFEQETSNENSSGDVKGQGNASQNTAEVEKGQIEMESSRKEKSTDEPSDSEVEPDADAYNFTEDQKRAMMELMVQKQEDSDLLDEEPPEYNVKGRLEQLNAELANEPTPVEGDREAKVGFKSEIVDLVAPPPTFSDDESQPNSARGETDSPSSAGPSGSDDKPTYDKYSDNEGSNKKTFVVERDGNFEVLGINELTASERELYISEDDKDSKDDQNHKRKENSSSHPTTPSSSPSSKNQNSKSSETHSSNNVNPRPPARPRPNTATVSSRRNVRPAQSPRPKSASQASGHNTSLDNFNYCSPYAMTPEQKEQGRQLGRKSEEEKMERERRRQEEDEEKRKDSEKAFRAWLNAKSERDKQRQSDENERNSQSSDKKEDNDAAFKTWLKEKRNQGKKDKLLKRRQQQEMMEGFYVRPREECEKAFKEWLRKKNAALREQHEMERQRSRLYRIHVKKSKKSQAVAKAMKESQSFRYVDYYGYRF